MYVDTHKIIRKNYEHALNIPYPQSDILIFLKTKTTIIMLNLIEK